MMPEKQNAARLLAYHERTKHHWNRFAASPGAMDWANQPAPFRTYAGARAIPLPLVPSDPPLAYAKLFDPPAGAPQPFGRVALGAFLEFSLALSAWKAIQGHRWALRINPSSGNLHPTEAHLITLGLADLPDGLYHYHPLDHALEERAQLASHTARGLEPFFPRPCLLVALTSIFWREAWKYGERAFRYCQHDTGHALAALILSARLLGWRMTQLEAVDADIAAAFGLDRTDWPPGDEEVPSLVAAVVPGDAPPALREFPAGAATSLSSVAVAGRPNRLSARHREWEVIREAAAAARRNRERATLQTDGETPPVVHPPPPSITAAAVIRQRRSAQAFDPAGRLEREAFFGLLDRTVPRAGCPPFHAGPGAIDISLVLFVHRVEGMAPGIYAFLRHPAHLGSLRGALSRDFRWEAAADLPLFLLEPGDVRAEAMDLACRQEIGGFSTFSLGMLARFEPVVRETPSAYRRLFWEAGMIGQVLYLEAEACGMRGTGIGCYFDDPVHERLGLRDRSWQSLYHFTVGLPLEDRRLQTLPPYHHLAPGRKRPDDHA